MIKNISRTVLLIVFAICICCVIYPAVLWGLGKMLFPFQAGGSVLYGTDKKPVGSLLIAQPFTQEQYFQPRPSAASYNGGASSSAALAPSNYALRSRVATMIGAIVRYKGGPKAGQRVGPDIESWFQKDVFGGARSIVSQWATAHGGLAQAWVSADSAHIRYVNAWASSHPREVAQFIAENHGVKNPGAVDLASIFFVSFSKENPGKFPPGTGIGVIDEGPDIQSIFFDMWRQDHPSADLQDVPGDMVTTSASGLDPHITLENAYYQIDRVAQKWAQLTHRDQAQVREEILGVLRDQEFAPFNGLAGDKMVNVLKVNMKLQEEFGAAPQRK